MMNMKNEEFENDSKKEGHHEPKESHEKYGAMQHESHEHEYEKHASMSHENKSESSHEHGGHEHGGHVDHQSHHEMMVKDFRKRFIVSAVLTIPVLILSPLVQQLVLGRTFEFPFSIYILWLLSSIIYIYGGWPFFTGARDELKKRLPGMMTLVALAITVAYVYSTAVVFFIEGKDFFWELATLIDIMLLGHWIEMRSVLGASRALESLAKLMPSEAHLIVGENKTVDVPLSQLKVGDLVLVKPGEKIPVDGEIVKGESSINEAMLTGESTPVFKKKGDQVLGGSINGDGSLVVKILQTGDKTYLAQVIKLVKEAQMTRSRTQDLANRAAFYLTIIAIVAGAITFAIWMAINGDVAFALERTVTVMVITCPHALGLAVPLVVSVSTSISASNGLLIRDRNAFENVRKIDVIVFDKTGTLTEGKFGVTEIIPENGFSEEDVLSYAAALESNSEHPIARGIVNAVKERNLKLMNVSNFKAIPGKGVEGNVNGKSIKVVSPGFLKEIGITLESEEIKRLQEQGKTTVHLIIDDKLAGTIALADMIRPESRESINRLKKMGIKCMMLTGDNKQVARWVAEELELDEFFAEVLPHEKSNVIKELQERGYTVAMVGDGINDAPALTRADVGIAIGAGTDVAIESADIILVRNDPRDILTIIQLSQNTYKKMIQNLAWATGYNAIAIPLAAGVLFQIGILLSPAAGAALMSLSTVIVAINARLLKI